MRRPVFASPMKLFKPRSRTRDAKTDTARTAAIFTAIETACLDIEAERKGLVNRYERAKLRAGDLLAAVDSGEDTGLRVPLDEMEEAMTYSERSRTSQATIVKPARAPASRHGEPDALSVRERTIGRLAHGQTSSLRRDRVTFRRKAVRM
jgi:hypothetical protein